MDSIATTAVRHFDPAGIPGVLGLPCAACQITVIIVNARDYTDDPLYCAACRELIDHPNTPIPYRLVDRGYIQPVSA